MASRWFSQLVNAHQTPAERKAKYTYARQQGLSIVLASRCRDWRWSKIYRVLGEGGDRRKARQMFGF